MIKLWVLPNTLFIIPKAHDADQATTFRPKYFMFQGPYVIFRHGPFCMEGQKRKKGTPLS